MPLSKEQLKVGYCGYPIVLETVMPNAPRKHRPPSLAPSSPPRRSAHARGYGRSWRRLREAFLMAHPLCEAEGCTRVATDVDHVVAREKGGTDDDSNLMALCHACHSKKTVRVDQHGVGGARRKA